MKLLEVIKAIQEDKLPVEKLEAYRDSLVNFFAECQLELADIRKKKAIYMIENKADTAVATERNWQVTKDGQREIDLAHWSKATEKLISSLKNRIYRLY